MGRELKDSKGKMWVEVSFTDSREETPTPSFRLERMEGRR